MEKNRLEAFSDGVLAIIITIMVLEFRQPDGDTLDDFLELIPILMMYLQSFLFISIYWVNHHLIFHDTETINVKILWCNIAWLFIMSFIPFGTAWLGTYPTSYTPMAIYFADMALACFTFHQMYYLILQENGQKLKLDARSITSIIVYTAAAAFGGFCPIAAFIAVAAVSVWWIVPNKNMRVGKKES